MNMSHFEDKHKIDACSCVLPGRYRKILKNNTTDEKDFEDETVKKNLSLVQIRS